MIAKYAGKCDLTATPIVAGVTEIAKVGPFTVLAEYATQKAIDAWFVTKTAEVEAIANEITQLKGRENRMVAMFSENLARRRSNSMANIKFDAEWVRNEMAQMNRILDSARQQA